MPAASGFHPYELPILHAPLDVERVPGLVQRAATASQDHGAAGDSGERGLDLVGIVGPVMRGGDACCGESLVCIQRLYHVGQ